MKKLAIYIFVIAVMVLNIACKKNYSCRCVTTITHTGTISVQEIVSSGSKTYSAKMTKKQAESACKHEGETINTTFNDDFKQGAAGTRTAKTSCSIQ